MREDLVDTYPTDTYTATTTDVYKASRERAELTSKASASMIRKSTKRCIKDIECKNSELKEARDNVLKLSDMADNNMSSDKRSTARGEKRVCAMRRFDIR